MSAYPHPTIEGLINLVQREDLDMRPTLLRVIVDLYVQTPEHTRREQARFSELVCRLLDTVDAVTRLAVARKIADYPAPAVVIAKLAREEISVAEPVLRRSPLLGEAELHAILDSHGPAHARAIAARADLPESVARRLAAYGNLHAQFQPTPPVTAARLRHDDPALTLTLARRFLVGSEAERRLILLAMPACAAIKFEASPPRMDRAFLERLEAAALRHRPQEFSLLLRQRIKLAAETCNSLIEDPAGDGFVVLCHALGLEFETTARMLLFLNPGVGRSPQSVYALAELYETMLPAAARRLLAAWCALASPAPSRTAHVTRRTGGLRTAQPPAQGIHRIEKFVAPRPAMGR